MNFHLLGLGLMLGIMVWPHTDQNARISRMEARLETNMEAKIDGVEWRLNDYAMTRRDAVLAQLKAYIYGAACQCQEEK